MPKKPPPMLSDREIRRILVVVSVVAILLVYQAVTGEDLGVETWPGTPESPVKTQVEVGSGWYTLYFTDPYSPGAGAFQGGADAALAEAIASARLSVDVAAYQFNLWSVRDALLDARRRGVQVRVVTDSDYLDEEEILTLSQAGIPVLGDRREGLMHNKFIIIDRYDVWTGSMNLTVNGAYRNNNNSIRLRSNRLAENYLTEFEEMFVDDRFGPTSPSDTPYPVLTINETRVETYFSPEDNPVNRLVELIEGARESVHFLAYSFTSDEIALAMIDRHRAGVTVSGVFEASQASANTGGEYEHLRDAGLDVRLDGNPHQMHHKVIIIDGHVVITGSYNFSANAENRNDENTLILFDSAIAGRFLAEFQEVYEQGQGEVAQD